MRLLALAAAALVLGGCQKSVDQRFEEMCQRISGDQRFGRDITKTCRYRSHLSDQDKADLLALYDRWVKAKAAVEDGL